MLHGISDRLSLEGIYIGTSGWYYRKWSGVFYPEELPTHRWFRFYSERFNAVEINASFYRMPKVNNVKTWVRPVKDRSERNFIFSVKLNRKITHEARLNPEEIGDYLDEFLGVLHPLNGRLGAILIQLPPGFKPEGDNPRRLEKFARILRETIERSEKDDTIGNFAAYLKDIVYAVEFRHSGWFDRKFYEFIESLGFTVVAVDAPLYKKIPFEIRAGGHRSSIYIRLHGRNPKKWYRYNYSPKELEEIAERIIELKKKSGKIFIFFDNDYGGYAPKNAEDLMKLLIERI